MIYAAGVDVGSTQTKAIILSEDRKIVGRALINTGAFVSQAAERAFKAAAENAKIPQIDVGYVVGTGYGRYKVNFGNAQITEISCHARGAKFLFPNTQTVIDMGGQDAKGIRVGADGDVKDFVMNDKCAAGTGRFLSNAADTLGVSLDDIGPISLQGKKAVRLSTVCAVFVESDIMSYLAEGKTMPDILAGVHSAIAARTVALVRRVGIEPEVSFTGGVSRNLGMVKALEEKLQLPVNVCEDSHYIGAIGAALFALERSIAGVAEIKDVDMSAPGATTPLVLIAPVPRLLIEDTHMDYIAGIDIGCKTTKAVIVDESQHICGSALTKTRPDFPAVAREVLEKAVASAGGRPEDVKYVASTGLGRYNIPFRDLQITEITCAARGAAFLFPNTKCVLDVGGQSTSAIKLREGGQVKEFKSNDKCAAGSGGFLERAAHYLEIPLDQLGPLSMAADNPQMISSVCAVLAESEIINKVNEGHSISNIIRGIHNSLASRSKGLLARVGMEGEVTFVGGVARQSGMVEALKETLGNPVNVSESPDLVSALGAALLALKRYQKLQSAAAPGDAVKRGLAAARN